MYNRHCLRMNNYDYSLPNIYFITICTYKKEHTLSSIDNKGKIHLSELGKIINSYLKIDYNNIVIHEYIIMPNHIHLIIQTTDKNINLSNFIRKLKSKICRKYRKIFKIYTKGIWQRDYYDRIIRNKFELQRITEYIKNNPYKWINNTHK